MTAAGTMRVFILNGMDVPLRIAVVRNAEMSICFYVSPRRVPIPTGEIMKRDSIECGEAFAMLHVPAIMVPRIIRKGFDEEPKLTLTHGKKDGVRVLVFTVRPWAPGEREAAEAERRERDKT